MRFLVFQHVACEHPGIFRDFMRADGIAWDAVELDEGEAIPSLDGYDALLVMGGPMDVWQEAEHPWLAAEKQAIREAVVERRLPYLGLCLGHQLLGAALGGEVGPGRREVGVLEVELTEEGRRDPLLAGLPPTLKALQWHSAEVKTLPQGAVLLASSPLCDIQALRYERAWGLQFHVEMTDTTVAEWGAIPAYAQALDETLGPGGLQRLREVSTAEMPAFKRAARQLYDNFLTVVKTG